MDYALKYPTKTFSCRLQEDVLQLVKHLASTSKESQSATVTRAVHCLANHLQKDSKQQDNVQDNVKHSENDFFLKELQKQLSEKDVLIRNLTEQINSLIRQNDQSQQLIAAFSQINEKIKLLENNPDNNMKDAINDNKSKKSKKQKKGKKKNK